VGSLCWSVAVFECWSKAASWAASAKGPPYLSVEVRLHCEQPEIECYCVEVLERGCIEGRMWLSAAVFECWSEAAWRAACGVVLCLSIGVLREPCAGVLLCWSAGVMLYRGQPELLERWLHREQLELEGRPCLSAEARLHRGPPVLECYCVQVLECDCVLKRDCSDGGLGISVVVFEYWSGVALMAACAQVIDCLSV
jgi:hypothetical protein